jgi:hypothetical protein
MRSLSTARARGATARPASFAHALTVLAVAAALAAGCGDAGDRGEDAQAAPSGDTAAGARVQGGGAADPAPDPERAPSGRADAPGDGVAVDSSAPSATDGTWSLETRTREGTRPAAELVSARAAAHAGYDRLVLEFRDHVPGYTIGYVGSELRQCGSGRPVERSAPHALIVELRPAAGHDAQGEAAEGRTLLPGLSALRLARIICDYEGVVEWVVETERRVPIRVMTLRDPARLVLDLRTD